MNKAKRPVVVRGIGGLALGLIPLFSGGCATITHGTTQAISISTRPENATVSVEGRTYATPCRLQLERRSDHTLVFGADGYQSATRLLTRKQTRAILGNIWLGGLIGMGVDAATGANHELVPSSLHVELEPIQTTPMEASARLTRRLDEAARWEEQDARFQAVEGNHGQPR